MYSSFKKRQNRVKYSISYKDPVDTVGDNWYEETSNSYKETVEDLSKIKEPGEKLDETVLSNPVINSVTEDPKSLNPPLKNKPRYQNASLSSPGKKTTFSMNKLFMFILVIFLLYCVYNYSNKSIGKSFFGARECISYDISNAYNMVR